MCRPILAILFLCGLALAQPDLRPTQVLKGHTANIFNVAYGPAGTTPLPLLASAGKDRKIRLWNPVTGVEVRVLEGHTEDIYRVLFSPAGTLLASAAGDRTVRLWNPRTGALLKVLPGTGVMFNLAFSPDGKLLAGSSADGFVRVWQVSDGKVVRAFQAHADRCLGLAFSPDGKTLATAAPSNGTAGGGDVILWDTATWTELRRMNGARGTMAIAFSPSGTSLAGACTDQTVRVWEVGTGREVLKLEGHTEATYFVAFSPDGRRLASCSGNWNGDKAGEAIVWDVARGQRLVTLGGYLTPVWSLAFHPGGNEIATASGKWAGANIPGEVRLWSLSQLKNAPPVTATAELVNGWWADLHGEDAGKAYRAGWAMSQAGPLALPLLRDRIRPPRSVAAARIAKWIEQLDDDDYDIRETATTELEKLGSQVRGAMVAVLESPSLERRRRARQILERVTDLALSGAEVNALRELDVLARLGAPARPLVERYTSNADGTPVGTAARRVLKLLADH